MLHTAHTHQMAIFTLNMEIGKKFRTQSISQSTTADMTTRNEFSTEIMLHVISPVFA